MIGNLKQWWAKRTGYEKCYFLAFWISVLSLVFPARFGRDYKDLSIALVMFSACLCVIGLFIWSAPFLKIDYLAKLKNSVSNFIKGIIAIASIGLSRVYVSEALGLPSNDFDLTVGALAIFIGYLLWVFVFVFLAQVLSVLFLIISVAKGFLGGAVNTLLPTLSLFIDQVKVRSTSEDLNRKAINWMGHSFGLVSLALVGTLVIQSGEALIKNNLRFIRLLAYALDYQTAKKYPLVESNMRFRLHDNGIVSYAERDGLDIKITIDKVP
jgi:hypothetical protein